MKVRATQDGTYDGYYRDAGEIFEIDGKPFPCKDEKGLPMFELDAEGKQKLDAKGKPVIKMASHFSKNWMEEVNEKEEVTNEYPKFEIPKQYKIPRKKASEEPVTLKQVQEAISASVI